jgi:cytochrome c oxidase subunit 1
MGPRGLISKTLAGMPRRIPDYPDAFAGWNLVSSFGSMVSIVATVLFIYILYDLLSKQEYNLANNYWRVPAFFESTTSKEGALTETASTLEWSLASPPAFHTYNSLPVQS